ncbi:uncharacterized protein VTP21DRAFT_7966 [Calcarisporiella thermophila]|uniref:uncharacterized protein n=1 Tax=Calcarisporiella thermophila TaxID=911321 RepID=UPI003742181D
MTAWKTQLPEKPTPSIVVVKNISPSVSEKTVKDFFLFCGKIKEFELQKEAENDNQTALVWFERETAAKTACMLNNALIGDQNVSVDYFFEGVAPSEENKDGNGTDQSVQESKPVTKVVVEILAAGYNLQDSIVSQALALDQKYSVSTIVQSYLKRIQDIAKQIDEKYKVSTTVHQKATQLDEKFKVQDRVKGAAASGQERANQVLQSPTGQRVQSLYTHSSAMIQAVHAEAKKLAEEKKAKQQQAKEASSQKSQEQQPQEEVATSQ